MTDILSLIDHAIEDYGTSDDAMRWVPEPDVAGFVRAAGVEMSPWQAEVARLHFSPGQVFCAPIGSSPESPEGWTDLGTIAEDGVTYALTSVDVAELFEVPAVFTTTATVSFTTPLSSLSLAMYWLLFRRRHPRARAMHCAYSRRLRARRRRR